MRKEMKLEVLKLGAKAALRSAVRPPEEWERLGFKMEEEDEKEEAGKPVGLTGGSSLNVLLGSDARKEKSRGSGSKSDVARGVSYAVGGTPGDGSRCSTPKDGAKRSSSSRGSTPPSEMAVREEL